MKKLRFVVTTGRPVDIPALAEKVGKKLEEVEAVVPKVGDPRPIVKITGAAAEELFIAIDFFEGGITEIDFVIE